MNVDNSTEFEYLHKQFEIESKSSNSFISYFLVLLSAISPSGVIWATLSGIPTPLHTWAILLGLAIFVGFVIFMHLEEARNYALRYQIYARIQFVNVPKPRIVEEFVFVVLATCTASLSAITAYDRSVKLQEIGVGLEKPELSPESLFTMVIFSVFISIIFALTLLFFSKKRTYSVTV
jgi:hypothetical protein